MDFAAGSVSQRRRAALPTTREESLYKDLMGPGSADSSAADTLYWVTFAYMLASVVVGAVIALWLSSYEAPVIPTELGASLDDVTYEEERSGWVIAGGIGVALQGAVVWAVGWAVSEVTRHLTAIRAMMRGELRDRQQESRP